ncbi:MFS transporter [Undibacterium cyanobacteriorum]|uniref:MFS transporter n=1 Tax=Undibacterium cyanobacteriorum TaxID=3073561 RepID=A0ABY9RMP7_9BURK|nr:MFS transporter [Undibacterium sp. 20NA77.5]WMW82473.1 MFS transporter [Undibacterium sp. 20NA77.5]
MMKNWGLFHYGLLGLPLAMVSLPLYVQLPAFYSSQFALSLSSIGYVLFAARFLDTLQDPVIGALINRRGLQRPVWYFLPAVLISIAFAALWSPPTWALSSATMNLVWLAVMLYIAYSAHSVLNIAYLSWGAALDDSNPNGIDGRVKSSTLLGAATWREGFALVGVIIASIVPSLIMNADKTSGADIKQQSSHFLYYSLCFAATLTIAIVGLLRFAHRPPTTEITRNRAAPTLWKELKSVSKDVRARPLFVAYFMNSLAIALPASLMIFFVDRQIQAPDKLPHFLVSYFISGALGLALWLKAAKKFGSLLVWQSSLLISITAFIGAAFLSSGDAFAYTLICITSGLCLGADLVLPPVLLAERIQAKQSQASYFGIWTFLGKIALACSGLALPLMAYLENEAWLKQASVGLVDNIALVLCYALIPCALKLLTFISLIGIKFLDQTRSEVGSQLKETT